MARHNSHHPHGVIVQMDGLPDNAWVAAKASLPQSFAQQRDIGKTCFIRDLECLPTGKRLDSERFKEAGRHKRSDETLRFCAVRAVERQGSKCRNTLERLHSSPIIDEVRR